MHVYFKIQLGKIGCLWFIFRMFINKSLSNVILTMYVCLKFKWCGTKIIIAFSSVTVVSYSSFSSFVCNVFLRLMVQHKWGDYIPLLAAPSALTGFRQSLKNCLNKIMVFVLYILILQWIYSEIASHLKLPSRSQPKSRSFSEHKF